MAFFFFFSLTFMHVNEDVRVGRYRELSVTSYANFLEVKSFRNTAGNSSLERNIKKSLLRGGISFTGVLKKET